jgi:predicted nucleic acid-binding protein
VTSEGTEKLAADANVILSAVIGKSALKIFTSGRFEIFTTRFNIDEVREYLPHLAAKYGLPQDVLLLQLALLPVHVKEEKCYSHKMREASALIAARDEDDAHLLALALALKIPVWSNDRHFAGLPVPACTTAQLLKHS